MPDERRNVKRKTPFYPLPPPCWLSHDDDDNDDDDDEDDNDDDNDDGNHSMGTRPCSTAAAHVLQRGCQRLLLTVTRSNFYSFPETDRILTWEESKATLQINCSNMAPKKREV
ncbi:hypothetical protein AAFF_G00225360 [Aldrovandia affinis]|uniref:Uncharacterized protein n=1 Tax=Aldrovandia affinis TaxID=143900 RepID=A0AAD7TCC0_9TELE|nr:hypothetical protein AAFF_G00225360 [Aldrovandia affinis]